MNSQVSKEIIRDLKRRHGITEVQAREIIKSQFALLKTAMEKYNREEKIFPTIRLPKFGLFFIKPSKLENYGNKNTD